MGLQDLTPQLRTRLSRMERTVGWFVLLAAALLVFGFAYYMYDIANRKGWFKSRATYFTFTDRATGLKVGDPVKLMGFGVGQITRIDAQPPGEYYNVYVEFEILQPYYGYLWTRGSRAKIATADLLGNRILEVTKGTGGYPAYIFFPFRQVPVTEVTALPDWKHWLLAEEIYDRSGTNLLAPANQPLPGILDAARLAGLTQVRIMDPNQVGKTATAIWNDREGRYEHFTRTNKPYWLQADESPAVTERLEQLVTDVERALPGILDLTNSIAQVMSNTAALTSNLNGLALDARPIATQLAAATAHLDHPGAVGEWLLPTNTLRQLESVLSSADTALTSANTNLTALADNVGRSLDNLANITSNLNQQVQANTNMLSSISQAIVHTDELVQGLKRHWLLRSAFKTKSTNAPAGPVPLRSPKDSSDR